MRSNYEKNMKRHGLTKGWIYTLLGAIIDTYVGISNHKVSSRFHPVYFNMTRSLWYHLSETNLFFGGIPSLRLSEFTPNPVSSQVNSHAISYVASDFDKIKQTQK